MIPSDDDLLRAAVQGDRESLEQLIARHGPMVRRKLEYQIDHCWRTVLSVDDVMQQTFLDAFLFIGRFEPRGVQAFVGWLTNMARRNLIDAVRELKAAKRGGDRVRFTGDSSSLDDSYVDLFERIGGTVTSPSQAVAAREAETALKAALQQVPETYRQAIHLYDLDGRNAMDVAHACGCSVGAMHMRRSRALGMLRTILCSGTRFFD
ncbi:MAG: RNA polymerase sigma factor [Planctomycetaceae bacterium]